MCTLWEILRAIVFPMPPYFPCHFCLSLWLCGGNGVRDSNIAINTHLWNEQRMTNSEYVTATSRLILTEIASIIISAGLSSGDEVPAGLTLLHRAFNQCRGVKSRFGVTNVNPALTFPWHYVTIRFHPINIDIIQLHRIFFPVVGIVVVLEIKRRQSSTVRIGNVINIDISHGDACLAALAVWEEETLSASISGKVFDAQTKATIIITILELCEVAMAVPIDGIIARPISKDVLKRHV